MKFWAELRRRHVVRVAVVYLIAAWLMVQVAGALEPALGLPAWFDTLIVALLALCFPAAIVLAWAFELTPDGVKRAAPALSGPADSPLAPPAASSGAEHAAPILATGPDLHGVEGTRSIAVLPFVNMSPDPDQEYFSDGLSEELLNQLAQIEDLRVAARTSSFYFKGKDVDLREVASKLGVSHVLEGSVRKAGDRLRITAQLISAADGYHLWSQAYDRRLDDVFAIQDELARAVAEALSVTLGVGHTTAATGLTDDVETYELYLRGRASFNRSRPEDFARAAEFYGRAIARDPGFSRARAGLVHIHAWMPIFVPERRAEAEQAIAKAVAEGRARAPDDWSTHLASAVLHMQRHEWAGADDAFARAAEGAPASVPERAEIRSMLLLNLGRVADALGILEASMSSDPLSVNRSWQVQFALDMLGRTEEAEEEYLRSLDLPGADAREELHHWALLRVWNGADTSLIEARFDAFLKRQTVPTPWLADIRAVYDDRDAALAIIRAAHGDPANQDPTRLHFVAAYACHFGDAALALEAMRRALVDMRGVTTYSLWYPDMAVARRLPGFKDLVRDIGLADYWRQSGHWGDFCRPLGDDDFECA